MRVWGEDRRHYSVSIQSWFKLAKIDAPKRSRNFIASKPSKGYWIPFKASSLGLLPTLSEYIQGERRGCNQSFHQTNRSVISNGGYFPLFFLLLSRIILVAPRANSLYFRVKPQFQIKPLLSVWTWAGATCLVSQTSVFYFFFFIW